MDYQTPDFIKRYEGNPVVHAGMVPYEAVCTYNAGITRYNGKYVMVFRNDHVRNKENFMTIPAKINLGLAFSDDGFNWEVAPKPCLDETIFNDPEILRLYDPRLTVIDGKCYLCFAVDTYHGVCGGVAVTEDFSKFEVLSISAPDNRNMVLFPEKINGRFMRLERPFPVYSRGAGSEKFDIWSASSADCRDWGRHKLVLGAEKLPYCNSKIGPGAPPVKTSEGWLCAIHAVEKVEETLYAWHPNWHKIYYAGLMLLDLEDPNKVLSVSEKPLLVPETLYEKEGMIGSVIFPGGMILEDSGEVKIYYGAADTVECLATADINDLLKFVKNEI